MTEETFTRELERRADHVHGAPLSLDDVRGKARSIRRRRQATAAAAVAAVVALVLVVPTVLADHLTRSDGPEPAPSPPGHTAVLHAGELTLPDGGTVPLDVDNQDVTQLGVLRDGRIVVALQKPYAVRVYAPDGTLDQQYDVAINAITMGPADRLVAWMDDTFRVRVLESGVAEPVELQGIPMPGESPGSIDAVLGSDCAGGGCRILGGDHSTTTTVATQDTQTDLATPEPLRVDDVSPDGTRWAVSFPPAPDEQFGCSGLYDPEARRVLARSCETSGLRFAPDGQHLIGMRGDNNMAGSVDILDTDLDVLTTFTPDGREQVVSRAQWFDSTHLVVAVADLGSDRWSLLHVGLGGTAETVDGPVDGRNPEIVAEYLLSE